MHILYLDLCDSIMLYILVFQLSRVKRTPRIACTSCSLYQDLCDSIMLCILVFQLSRVKRTTCIACTSWICVTVSCYISLFFSYSELKEPHVLRAHPAACIRICVTVSCYLSLFFSYPELKEPHVLRAHPAACICIKFDPTGKYFATGSADALVSLWDSTELVCVRTFARLYFSRYPRIGSVCERLTNLSGSPSLTKMGTHMPILIVIYLLSNLISEIVLNFISKFRGQSSRLVSSTQIDEKKLNLKVIYLKNTKLR